MKLKLSSKCKFYGNDIEHKKLTKKRVKKILKYSDGYCYDTLKSVYLIATRDLRISGCNFFYLKIKGLCDFLRKRF